MNESTKELIAIGASIAAHCQPCLTAHVDKARNLGIGDDEIREAIEVGATVRRGAMSFMDKFAKGILEGTESISSSCCDSSQSNCCR